MTLYSYTKTRHHRSPKHFRRLFSFGAIFSGLVILGWVLYPILSFEIIYAPQFGSLIQPVPEDNLKQVVSMELSQILGLTTTDYTKASVWFPKAANVVKLPPTNSNSVYTLSIPKLNIEQAQVKVGGEDLAKNLIHYTGPLPGKTGNPVIFGHSTIPLIYNPKDYKTIFTKLQELKKGDEIFTTVDSITYRYRVFDMKVVTPDALSVLEQNSDDSYITLITCVPPGTYLKRLVVKGKLANL